MLIRVGSFLLISHADLNYLKDVGFDDYAYNAWQGLALCPSATNVNTLTNSIHRAIRVADGHKARPCMSVVNPPRSRLRRSNLSNL